MTRSPGAVLFTRHGCCLCFTLTRLANRSARRHALLLTVVDVDTDPELARRYGERVPVLEFPDGGSIAGSAAAIEVDEAFRRAAKFVKRGMGGKAGGRVA